MEFQLALIAEAHAIQAVLQQQLRLRPQLPEPPPQQQRPFRRLLPPGRQQRPQRPERLRPVKIETPRFAPLSRKITDVGLSSSSAEPRSVSIVSFHAVFAQIFQPLF